MLQPVQADPSWKQVPYLKAGLVQDSGIQDDELPLMWASVRESAELALEVGDLLVLEGGDAGRAVLVETPLPGAIFQNSLHRVRSQSRAESRWLWYCLQALHGSGWFGVACNAATLRHLTVDKLRRLPIPDASHSEKASEVDFLDRECARIDELIAEQQRLLALVEARLLAAQTEVALQGLTPNVPMQAESPQWMGPIPAHWKLTRLKYESRLESGHTPTRSRPELWENCRIPWVSLNDVGAMKSLEFIDTTVNKISDEGLAASSARILPAGTVILSRDATIGRCAILQQPMATSQHFADYVCGPELHPRYLWLLFRTAMQPYFDSLTDGATLKTIGMGDLKNFAIPRPPMAEQVQIVARAEELRAEGAELQEALRHAVGLLKEHKQALITSVVTGQKEVA